MFLPPTLTWPLDPLLNLDLLTVISLLFGSARFHHPTIKPDELYSINRNLLIFPCCLLPAATKLGQSNIFTGVCLSTGGCLTLCMLGYTLHPPRADPPRADTPPRADPQEQTPTREQTPPPHREADSSIRSTSGRYASYWNAFLFADIVAFIR